MGRVTKKINSMFSEISRLDALENVTIDGLGNIPAVNSIRKADRKLQLKFNAVLDKELHEVVSKPSLGRLFIHTSEHTYEIENNQAFFEGYNFMTYETQTFTMNISALKDVEESEGYLRLVIPVDRNYWVHILHTYALNTEFSSGGGLMILNLDKGEVHVFTVTEGKSNHQYLVVEPQYEVTKETLFNIHYAVAVGLGLITGTAYFGEAYVLVGNSLEFESYKASSYYSLRESVHSQYTTFSTNLYWVEMLLKQGQHNRYALDLIKNEKGDVKRDLVDWLYVETYGEIIKNMYLYPEFARAAIILIDGTEKALDYQAAMYAVALETLCTKLKKIYEMDFDGIIKDKGTWTRIRKPMTKVYLDSCNKYGIDEQTSNKIGNKIPKLNEISNSDKFKMVIERLGLNIMASDFDAIEQRNSLLHGELVKKTAEDSTDFDDMYYYSLVLHRLCTAIIFKYAGYHGCLVNNAVLMDRKPACDMKEPVLIMV